MSAAANFIAQPMEIEPKAFFAIERTVAAALHIEWDRLAASVLPSLHSAVERGDWARAETIANGLTLKGIVQKVRPKLEEMAVSALLVTSDVRQTAFMKGKAVPAELENALNQLEHAVEHDASDQVRKICTRRSPRSSAGMPARTCRSGSESEGKQSR